MFDRDEDERADSAGWNEETQQVQTECARVRCSKKGRNEQSTAKEVKRTSAWTHKSENAVRLFIAPAHRVALLPLLLFSCLWLHSLERLQSLLNTEQHVHEVLRQQTTANVAVREITQSQPPAGEREGEQERLLASTCHSRSPSPSSAQLPPPSPKRARQGEGEGEPREWCVVAGWMRATSRPLPPSLSHTQSPAFPSTPFVQLRSPSLRLRTFTVQGTETLALTPRIVRLGHGLASRQ